MNYEQSFLEFATDNSTTGFRLDRLEILNWGTFDQKVWSLYQRNQTI